MLPHENLIAFKFYFLLKEPLVKVRKSHSFKSRNNLIFFFSQTKMTPPSRVIELNPNHSPTVENQINYSITSDTKSQDIGFTDAL